MFHSTTYIDISLLVAVASLIVSVAANWIATRSLREAQRQWRQQKWFDLYFKADDAYDFFDYFRARYQNTVQSQWPEPQWIIDWNDLMRHVRTVHRMAMVFPQTNEIDHLLSATKFAESRQAVNRQQAIEPQHLQQMLDAVEGLRQNVLAKTHPELLPA